MDVHNIAGLSDWSLSVIEHPVLKSTALLGRVEPWLQVYVYGMIDDGRAEEFERPQETLYTNKEKQYTSICILLLWRIGFAGFRIPAVRDW